MTGDQIVDADGLDFEPEKEGLSQFEQRYKDQMRQIVTQRLDLPVSTLLALLEGQILINPAFQRRDRWDEERQSRLIESLLMNVPIPPVFLGEDDYGHYVVLDGRQRLTAVKQFLNNTLVLRDLGVWSELNGSRFDDLKKRGIDKHLTRRFISAIVLLKESSPQVKYDVFDRLNTGGVKANDMEVRNAVFQGPFNDALHELSADAAFCSLWDIPVDRIAAEENLLFQKMHDLLLALRFFALQDPSAMTGNFREYLGEFMSAKNKAYLASDAERLADAALFKRAMANCWALFGKDAFRNPLKARSGVRSAPIWDAVSIAVSGLPNVLKEDELGKYREAFAKVFADAEFQVAVSKGTNGKGAIAARITIARNALAAVAH